VDELVDSGDQMFDAPETTSANRLLGDESEPSFNLIEPAGVGGRVVDLEAGPLREPEAHLGMLVGGVVVDDQMNIEVFRHSLIDPFEELQKLLMTVACFALRQDRAGGDIKGGKEGGGAMANVVPISPGHLARRDYEYKRCGTANVFCAVEPKPGRHFTKVTPSRASPDFAAFLLDIAAAYPVAETIHLVLDNLSTHTRKAATDWFGEEDGAWLWSRFTIHHTPKHGSWLNQAEIEIGLLADSVSASEQSQASKNLRNKPPHGTSAPTTPRPPSIGNLHGRKPDSN
jgi:hypothetical protein